MLGDNKLTPSGQETRPDRCTQCTCTNSTLVCKRETCPPLDCPVEKQEFTSHNQCCPQCPRALDKTDTCDDNGKVYLVITVVRVFRISHVCLTVAFSLVSERRQLESGRMQVVPVRARSSAMRSRTVPTHHFIVRRQHEAANRTGFLLSTLRAE